MTSMTSIPQVAPVDYLASAIDWLRNSTAEAPTAFEPACLFIGIDIAQSLRQIAHSVAQLDDVEETHEQNVNLKAINAELSHELRQATLTITALEMRSEADRIQEG